MARTVKFMAKDINCKLNTIKLSNGNFIKSGRERLAEMLRVHFPNYIVVSDSKFPGCFPTISCEKNKWTTVKKVVTHDKVVLAILCFRSFRTPGMDGISLALIEERKFLASIYLENYYEIKT